jgi:hypothetical protein
LDVFKPIYVTFLKAKPVQNHCFCPATCIILYSGSIRIFIGRRGDLLIDWIQRALKQCETCVSIRVCNFPPQNCFQEKLMPCHDPLHTLENNQSLEIVSKDQNLCVEIVYW